MDFWSSILGVIEVELLCTDAGFALTKLTDAGIEIRKASIREDQFGVSILIPRNQWNRLRTIANKYGYTCNVQKKKGIYWNLKAMICRPVLIAGLGIFLFLSIYLPTRVLFFQVDGNSFIPDNQILQACENAGIGFGASRAEVRSERVKNALLEAIPELKWVGVNTKGCVAVITVQERRDSVKVKESGICSIVASRDGVITFCTASKGNLLAKPGQAVSAGDVLISGYTDCGLSIKATKAEGEIYAQTIRDISAVLPTERQCKGEIRKEIKKYALIIGKKRINFYKDSGNFSCSCDKMYLTYTLTLPGGFLLPVSLVEETCVMRDVVDGTVDSLEAEEQLAGESLRYLQSEMIAGRVMRFTANRKDEENLLVLNTKYFCHEMIGQVHNEEKLQPYGK